MKDLNALMAKYAKGGPVHPAKRALAAVQRAMHHLGRGNHQAAIHELRKSPEAMAHPEVQVAMRQMMPGMADGGHVLVKGVNTSSPASPGLSGAIKDAVEAAQDYFVGAPAREIATGRMRKMDRDIDPDSDPGYAEGGKVGNIARMAKFMTEQIGLDPGHASHLATAYHRPPVSSTAQQMATDIAHNIKPPSMRAPKAPAQLAQELQAGFVDPKDLQHLIYTDPTLTPLINRYQAGVDNQNLTPEQKQALIQKLQQIGQPKPPMPQPGGTQMQPQLPGGPPGPSPGPPGGAPGSGTLSAQNVAALLQGPH